MDEKRREAGQKLLNAAYEFWSACREEGQYGAVQWLEGTNGELIIFTRGEYKSTLLNNIWSLYKGETHYFGDKVMPDD